MGYMINDRDSFHGWWKDKPDTQFSGMTPLRPIRHATRRSSVWLRAAVILVLMFLFVLALKSLLGR